MAVRDTFDRVAADYDVDKHRILPGYSDLRAVVDRWSAGGADASSRTLELGCGTGQWAEAYLDRHPRAELVGVEFSAKMRELASVRLERFGARARLVDLDLNDGLPEGTFDLVTSMLAIHHVRDASLYLRMVEESRFDLAELDASAPYLDLVIAASQILELAVRAHAR